MNHYAATKKGLSLATLYTELKDLKQQPQTAWLREMDSQALQQVLQDLEKAFQAFKSKRSGFPKFVRRSKLSGGGTTSI